MSIPCPPSQDSRKPRCNPGESLRSRILVVIPVYNHAGTLQEVVTRTRAVHDHVLVVDDGSTDLSQDRLEELGVPSVCHAKNQGKGAAIRTGAETARHMGMTHIITIDADGQHDPADIPLFIAAIAKDVNAIIVGARDFSGSNIPQSSRFGRHFSNFWLRVQTGAVISDVQSGFRAYPVTIFNHLSLTENHYSFEVEVLVKAAWAGFRLEEVDVAVFYPKKEQRISHFKAFKDNVRISLLNTRLTIRSILPIPHTTFDTGSAGAPTPIHPIRSLQRLLADDATPRDLALACALGVFLGTLPLVAMHSIAILLAAGWLRLNKFAALAASQVCIPPIVPALCIEAGFFMRHGRFLTEISLQTLGYEAFQRLYEWILGSLVLAPLFAVATLVIVYVLSRILAHGIKHAARNAAR
ncbi:DUF2062 domain-containing protein [Desulfoplanes sp.]